MAAMLKKALSIVAALLFTASVSAAGPEVRTDHPDSYVVVKGDTLWDISGKFLKNPWYWPEIWQANPQIENPHLIYPGDVISLVYIDGEPRLLVNGSPPSESDVGPKIREENQEDAIPPLPLSEIRSFLTRPRILSDEEIESAPYITAVEENRVIASNRQVIYARRMPGDIAVGQKWVVVRPTVVYSEMSDGWLWNKDKHYEATPWSASDQFHWTPGQWYYDSRSDVLAREVVEIGIAAVTVIGDPATLYVTYTDIELRKGDLLLPKDTSPLPLNFYPHAPKGVPENTRVIGIAGEFDYGGPGNVVVISKGAQDGIEVGEVYSLYQPGETVVDEVAYPPGSSRALFNPRDKLVTLPDEFVGHTMIFRTFDRISYGLVVNGVKVIHLGDRVKEPTEL